jgi:hypothetical protein
MVSWGGGRGAWGICIITFPGGSCLMFLMLLSYVTNECISTPGRLKS